MSEYFIVLSHEPERHDTLAAAQAEQKVLARHFPEKQFKVHRCKRWLVGGHHFDKMVTLLGDIVREGLSATNLDRATLLLFTIGNRTPRLRIKQVDGPPEFQPRAPEALP